MECITAPRVMIVPGQIIKDGGVITQNGKIVAAGLRTELFRKYPDCREQNLSGLLMPPLVNAHHHLELSWLAVNENHTQCNGMVDWITSLLQRRMQPTPVEERCRAIEAELRKQSEDGVALLADVSNEFWPDWCACKDVDGLERVQMLEMLAPSSEMLESATARLRELPEDISVTAHGPCSTPQDLLVLIKNRCRKYNQLFSIHTAESSDEMEFVRHSSGPFEALIAKRGAGSLFDFGTHPDETPVGYLDRLDLLDEKTLLVHCVHVSHDDMEIVARRGAGVCLCPGSNNYLAVGDAPVKKMLESNINIGIGTDSKSSNRETSIWNEMAILSQPPYSLPPTQILMMATIGGACVLGRDQDFCGLNPGGRDVLLHVDWSDDVECLSDEEIESRLVNGSRPEVCSLLTDSRSHELVAGI